MEALVGQYAGRGSWHEANGDTDGYRIEQTIGRIDAGFEICFTHVFDNGDPDTVAAFDLRAVTPTQFRVLVDGTDIGQGYAFDTFCHYTTRFGDMIVEVSMIREGKGLRVFGSSSSNKAGNAIAWQEWLMLA